MLLVVLVVVAQVRARDGLLLVISHLPVNVSPVYHTDRIRGLLPRKVVQIHCVLLLGCRLWNVVRSAPATALTE